MQRVHDLEAELSRLNALLSGSEERAKASEEKERSRADTIMQLHDELSGLRERWAGHQLVRGGG